MMNIDAFNHDDMYDILFDYVDDYKVTYSSNKYAKIFTFNKKYDYYLKAENDLLKFGIDAKYVELSDTYNILHIDETLINYLKTYFGKLYYELYDGEYYYSGSIFGFIDKKILYSEKTKTARIKKTDLFDSMFEMDSEHKDIIFIWYMQSYVQGNCNFIKYNLL